MAEANERDVAKEAKRQASEPRQVTPPVSEKDKPSMKDYKSEDKNEMAKTKIEYTEVTPKEEERKKREQRL